MISHLGTGQEREEEKEGEEKEEGQRINTISFGWRLGFGCTRSVAVTG